MSVSKNKHALPILSLCMQAAEPLWQRVPTRTDAGECASDFMMIITRLNAVGDAIQQRILTDLYNVLNTYTDAILFAEVNMKMNLLWVSHRPRPGLGVEIASQIHHVVPEARLVANRF